MAGGGPRRRRDALTCARARLSKFKFTIRRAAACLRFVRPLLARLHHVARVPPARCFPKSGGREPRVIPARRDRPFPRSPEPSLPPHRLPGLRVAVK